MTSDPSRDDLSTAFEHWMATVAEQERLTREWGEDLASPERERRARVAAEVADDALEELERILADVNAVLDQTDRRGSA